MAMLAETPHPRNTQRRFTRAGTRVEFVAAGVGFTALLVTEFMHFSVRRLTSGGGGSDCWRKAYRQRSVALLTAVLMKAVQRHRAATLLRLQVISEMNQHVRTALTEDIGDCGIH